MHPDLRPFAFLCTVVGFILGITFMHVVFALTNMT